jgi:LPXTG-motif cell wall-anchored protein
MKKRMKLSVLHGLFLSGVAALMVLVGASMPARAQAAANVFVEDGLAYVVTAENAPAHTGEVHIPSQYLEGVPVYSGNLVVPETVEHAGFTYTVTGVDYGAFAETPALTSVTFPNAINSNNLSSEIFANSGIEHFVIPDSWTMLPNGMFRDCINLTQVTFGASLVEISDSAFTGTGFSELVIPEGIHTIGAYAFAECPNLERISLPDSAKNLSSGAVFFSCPNLTEVRLPADLAEIPAMMFFFCTSLTEVDIPESVTDIGMVAFAGTGMSEITIPAGVERIGDGAFANCFNLTAITFEAETPPELGFFLFADAIGGDVAPWDRSDFYMYVPAGSEDAYLYAISVEQDKGEWQEKMAGKIVPIGFMPDGGEDEPGPGIGGDEERPPAGDNNGDNNGNNGNNNNGNNNGPSGPSGGGLRPEGVGSSGPDAADDTPASAGTTTPAGTTPVSAPTGNLPKTGDSSALGTTLGLLAVVLLTCGMVMVKKETETH